MRSNSTFCSFVAAVMFLPLFPTEAKSSTSLSEADFRNIDAYIERELKEANIPGASLVIVEGNQIVHERGFGIAGPEGQPVTAETNFFLGSVSKSFTALAIMQLVEAGRIELNAPVQKYLPWFRVADPESSSQIKVRHLLNHTSGFSTYAGRTHFTDSDMSDEAIQRRVRDLRKVKLTAPVGKRFRYSNANYSILGAIIESVSGQRYEDYIQEHIFDPLNMTNSYTSREQVKQHNLATGYRYWFGQPIFATSIPYPRGDIAAAYLISCARDMGQYLLALMNGGTLGDTRILSESGVSKLHTPEKKNLYYAMGWHVGQIDNTRKLGHTGITPSSCAGIAIFPEYQRGFALFINAQNYLSGPDVLALVTMIEFNVLGKMAFPVSRAPKVHTELAMLCMLLLGQAIGFALSCRQIYRWRKYPNTRSRKKQWVILTRGGLSFIVDIGIAVGMLWWIPLSRDIPLSGLILYAPDAGWLLLLNGTLAIIAFIVDLCFTAFLIQQSGHIIAGTGGALCRVSPARTT
jgi:CubicO group peptidase (beta-lactamase class C family)